MTLRAAAVLLALAAGGFGIAGCASSPPADGGPTLADLANGTQPGDPRGLWVAERQVTRADTFPDADSVVVVEWAQLWASFELTDSTLVEEGVRRYQEYEPQIAAGGSRIDAVLDGETLTLVLDTARVVLSLRVLGDSLFVTGSNGRTDGYRRATSSAPTAATGTWVPEIRTDGMPPQLIVDADGFVLFAPDDPVGSLRMLGPIIGMEPSLLGIDPSVPGEYWNYEITIPYELDGDRLMIDVTGDGPSTFLRADG